MHVTGALKRAGKRALRSSAVRASASARKLPARARPFWIDAMAHARRQMPLHAARPPRPRRRAAANMAPAGITVSASPWVRRIGGRGPVRRRRIGQQAGKAHDRGRRHGAAQAQMQRQHRALAEAGQHQPFGRQAPAAPVPHPGIRSMRGAASGDTALHFMGIDAGKWETIESPTARRARGRAHWARQRPRPAAIPANAAPARSDHCRPRHSHAAAPPDLWRRPFAGGKARTGEQSHG